MVAVYKIHPGIGIARVGKSPDGFFLRRETKDGTPFELGQGGEVAFRGHKDANKLIRRQAARFRVYEYDKDQATGAMTLVREVTPDIATIQWEVKLANRKAAGLFMEPGSGLDGSAAIIPNPSGRYRNVPPAVGTREDLVAKVDLSIEGPNKPPGPRKTGKIGGVDVFIGEAATKWASLKNSWPLAMRGLCNGDIFRASGGERTGVACATVLIAGLASAAAADARTLLSCAAIFSSSGSMRVPAIE